MKMTRLFMSCVLISFLPASVECVQATGFTVVMGPTALAFSPSTLTISQGDTVTWTNAASAVTHTSTSGAVIAGVEHPDALWNGSDAAHATSTVNFSGFAPRTYPYYCVPHGTLGMVGSITVTGTSQVPSLTNLVYGASGQVQFAINGLIGQTNVTETSADLLSWSPIGTNLALSTSYVVPNLPTNTAAIGFYRVRLGP
jgi:plastocyanin